MQNNLELILSAGTVDLIGNEIINLNYSISDVRNLTDKKSTYSQYFRIPGTNKNNILFNDIWQISADSTYDPNKKMPGYILLDSNSIAEGYFQLSNIFVDNQKNVEYEGTFFGENDTFVKRIGASLLTDYDFSDLDHVWNYSNIVNSWTADTGYYYGLINYNGFGYDDINGINSTGTTSGLTISQFHPSISFKSIWDKIFSTIGMSYESSFINGDQFKRLWFNFAGTDTFAQPISFATTRQFKAGLSAMSGYSASTGQQTPLGTTGTTVIMEFDNDTTNGYFDNGGYYLAPSFTYSADTYSKQRFVVSLDYKWYFDHINNSWPGTNAPGRQNYRYFDVTLLRNTTEVVHTIRLDNTSAGLGLYDVRIQKLVQFPILDGSTFALRPTQPNDLFTVRLTSYLQSSFGNTVFSANTAILDIYATDTYWYNDISTDLIPGQTITVTDLMPQKTKAIDFINSVSNMFNLSFEPKKNIPNRLIVEPYEEFFSGGTVRNWTNKIDLNVPVKEQLLSELRSSQTLFTYTPDKDYWNTFYLDKVKPKVAYGEQLIIVDNDFLDPQSIETIKPIFSPSPLKTVNGSVSIIVPEIIKLNNNNSATSTAFNTRVFQSTDTVNKLLPTTSGEYIMFEGNVFNAYPYLGHLQYPLSANTGTDINFGQIPLALYQMGDLTYNNLYNDYWKKYIDEITDKDSKLITCSAYLTSQDIADFRFADTIFIDELTPEGGHYFIVNSIQYSPNSTAPAILELLKLKIKPSGRVISGLVRPRGGDFEIAPSNIITGFDNNIDGVRNIVDGVGNVITASEVLVVGDNNQTSEKNSTIFGSGNRIANGATNAFIIGNNFTATTANALYTNNIILSTGSTITIGNTVFSSTGTSGNIWTSGSTGTFSMTVANGTGSDATANYAISEGSGTQAIAQAAHAEGTNTTAGDVSAHAEGSASKAMGIVSHAEGNATLATGSSSHSEGNSTTASGANSHAEGDTTIASGSTSHAEGRFTLASGLRSHAEGSTTVASGSFSHSQGSNTLASGIAAHAEGDSTTAVGDSSHAEGTNSVAIGLAAHAEGSGFASGSTAHAEGFSTTAIGLGAHAEGFLTFATGLASHAEGGDPNSIVSSIASGIGSHVEGVATTASGYTAHAEGFTTTAGGDYSHAQNYLTIASGDYSHAEGNGTLASAINSHAEGSGTIASADSAHAEGGQTTASGTTAHAEGFSTLAGGDYSHAEGNNTTALGDKSHAEGTSTMALADSAHAEGSFTTASGINSHAGGNTAEATHYCEWARAGVGSGQGQYGMIDFYGTTSNATPTQIFVGSTGNQDFTIGAGFGYRCNITVIASESTVSNGYKEWSGSALIKNITGSTGLVGSATMTSVNGNASLATASVAVTANNTTDALDITVTGIAATNIKWYAKVDYIRVSV